MDKVKMAAMEYLSTRKMGLYDTVVFDIDDTLINRENKPIGEMITLYKFAELLGYKMIIITARPYDKDNEAWTKRQLFEIGIYSYSLYFASPMKKDDVKRKYKSKAILSVGDQWTDLTFSEKWIKLPDLDDSRILANFKSNKTSSGFHSWNN